MNIDKRLVSQVRLVKGALFFAVLAGILSGAAAVLQARQLSRVINGAFLFGQSLQDLAPTLWSLLGYLVARSLLVFFSEYAASYAAVSVKENLRKLFALRLFQLGPSKVQGERSGELINTAVQGIEALDAYFSQYLPQLALAGFIPVLFLAVVFPLDPLSGAVLLITGPLIPLFMFLIGSAGETLTRRQFQALSRMSAYFMDTIQGLATLKALGRSRQQEERIAQVSERYREATMSVLRLTFLSALALELLSTIGTAVVAVQIGLRLLYGRVGFEEAFFILLLAPDFYLPLRNLGLRFHASMTGVSAARRIFAVLDPAGEPESGAQNSAALRSLRSVSLREHFVIDFNCVRCAYPGRVQSALEDLSISIRSGQRVALLGASGAGKTTLAQLLMGFLSPDSGSLTVNGLPFSGIDVDNWRSQISWVPQQPYLFHDTIAANLRIARPEASRDDLDRAASLASLDSLIQSLPLGYETIVGEGGARLSGGQAQRLALARAFLRDAPLLILDEPTAHLDVEQEQVIERSLAHLCADRTVVVIAHRLITALNADLVLVLAGGRLLESGSPVDLLARGGEFARLASIYRRGVG